MKTQIATWITTLAMLGWGTAQAGIDEWTSLGLDGESITALVIDPQNPSTVYAGVGWSGLASGLYKSTDAGAHWNKAVNSGLPDSYPNIAALAIDPLNSGTVYVATSWEDISGGVFKSTDSGATWGAATSGLPTFAWISGLVIDPQNPRTVYAGTEFGVFKSMDGGNSWNGAGSAGPAIWSLVVDPQSPSTVYAGGSFGLWKSTDGGASWRAGYGQAVTKLAIDPQNPSTVYLATVNDQVLKSTDEGKSWTVSSFGLPGNGNWIGALVIDPQNPSTLYVGTSGAAFDGCSVPCTGFGDGVFMSTDGAQSWTAVTTGLTTTHVSALALDQQNPGHLYAGTIAFGTHGSAVFEMTGRPAGVQGTPTVRIVDNNTGSRTTLAVGDSFSFQVTGAPPLSLVSVSEAGWSGSVGYTDASGLFWLNGIVGSNVVGTWEQTWTIGGVLAQPSPLQFTITPKP